MPACQPQTKSGIFLFNCKLKFSEISEIKEALKHLVSVLYKHGELGFENTSQPQSAHVHQRIPLHVSHWHEVFHAGRST